MRRWAVISAVATARAIGLASLSGCDLDLRLYVDPIDGGTSPMTDSGNGATDAESPDSGQSQTDASPNQGDGGDASSRKRVFVTSTTTTGMAIGGVTGANAKCQQLATTANLGGTFIAWLSVNSDPVFPRLQNVGPWYLVYRTTLVFANKLVIAAVGTNVPIDRDEMGTKLAGTKNLVWTGTLATGQAAQQSQTCNSFAPPATGLPGLVGDANKQGAEWTQSGTSPCTTELRLYCIEQ